jgi:protein involved in polysaccharide export with SLBB domain
VVRSVRPIIERLPCPRLYAAAAGCLALAGCQTFFPKEPPPKPAAPPVADAGPVSPAYPVCFPDVLELDVVGRPDCSGTRLVYPDGRLDLGPAGEVFAEGCTATELTRRVADAAGVPAEQVHCRVAAARSRVVYLVGSGAAEQRAVSYRGPERATELLRRAGGLSAEIDPDVQVVRRNVARGTAIETFRVDLSAVRRGDFRTDMILEPNDEVHIAEDPSVRLASFLPGRSK